MRDLSVCSNKTKTISNRHKIYIKWYFRVYFSNNNICDDREVNLCFLFISKVVVTHREWSTHKKIVIFKLFRYKYTIMFVVYFLHKLLKYK